MTLYTTKQLAKLCNYADSAIIRKMILDGHLKASKFGHSWMIKHYLALKNKNIAKRLKRN